MRTGSRCTSAPTLHEREFYHDDQVQVEDLRPQVLAQGLQGCDEEDGEEDRQGDSDACDVRGWRQDQGGRRSLAAGRLPLLRWLRGHAQDAYGRRVPQGAREGG